MLLDAVGRLPEELPLGGAAAALEDPGGARAASRRGRSGCRRPRRSTTMPASARVPIDIVKPERLSAASRAGQPEARVRRARRRLGEARRRRPARATGPSAIASTALEVDSLNTISPTECPSWAKLAQHAESWRGVHLRELFAAERRQHARERQFVAEAPGVRYDYSRQRLGAMTLRLLAHLAAERGFADWREALLAGSRDQLDREARRLAYGVARRRFRACRSEGNAGADEKPRFLTAGKKTIQTHRQPRHRRLRPRAAAARRCVERRRARRALRRQRRSARPAARARRRRAGEHALHRRVEDLHHAGDDGECRCREALGRESISTQ